MCRCGRDGVAELVWQSWCGRAGVAELVWRASPKFLLYVFKWTVNIGIGILFLKDACNYDRRKYLVVDSLQRYEQRTVLPVGDMLVTCLQRSITVVLRAPNEGTMCAYIYI